MNFKEIASTMTNGEIVDAIKILHEEQQRRKKALKARHQKFLDEFYNVLSESQDEDSNILAEY